ncbi:MAG: hypothetical protein DSZ27_07955 [Thiomicrospira sp.]|nr:MAG: hypothetical protein DSZ27_07955 [Thiomicrospira sp.]
MVNKTKMVFKMIQTNISMMKKINASLPFALLLTFVHATPAWATETEAQLLLGGFYASGQSDIVASSDSEVIGIPIGLNVQKGRWSGSVLTSYLKTYRKDDSLTNQSESGMGDTFITLGYDLTQMPWITLSLNHKIPTGSVSKGLSTGEADTGVQLDYFNTLSASNSVFASIGYKSVGRVSGVAMQDPMNASVGASQFITKSVYIGGSIDYNESIYKELKDTTGVSLFSGISLTKRHQLLLTTYYDNTDSYQISANISISLFD